MSYSLGGNSRKFGSSSSSRPSSLYSSSPSFSLLGGGYNQNLSSSTPYLNSSSYYGGTSSGYGGIYIPPSSSSLKHNLSVPSIPGLPSLSPLSRSPTTSQYPSRSSSFNRHRSRLRARSLGDSVKSLLSEGYQSGDDSEVTSRLKSVVPGVNDSSSHNERISNENGEIIDYKKLYEESLVENERLRDKLRQTEEELIEAKTKSEKNALLASRNSLSETEKRERRAMERKLSEMEEELKHLQKLKSDNERLRAENRALTRVVSKLTSSHIK